MKMAYGGGLFQCFQESVERLIGEHVYLVNNKHLVPALLGPAKRTCSVSARMCSTELLEAASSSMISKEAFSLQRPCRRRRSLQASWSGVRFSAVQDFGEDPGAGRFAHPARTREQARHVPREFGGQRILQGAGDVLLTDHVLETLRAVLCGQKTMKPAR
jgi:hypothetical protein